jgi:hypothetical protein
METELETVAKKRVQDRMGFVVHAVMYAAMNAGLIVIWSLTGSSYPWFMWPALGWGIAVLAHAVTLAIGPGSERERRSIDREVRRMREARTAGDPRSGGPAVAPAGPR